MTEEEACAFGRAPLFDTCLRLRRWDEAAKIQGRLEPDLQPFEHLAIRVHERRGAGWSIA